MRTRRPIVVLIASIAFFSWKGFGWAADVVPPKDWVANGIVVTRGNPAKGEEPREIPNPDLSRIVVGRYSDKAGGPPVFILSRVGGRIFVRWVNDNLPPIEVVFGKPPTLIGRPPPLPGGPLLALAFVPDRDGRFILGGAVSGDVGGDLFLLP